MKAWARLQTEEAKSAMPGRFHHGVGFEGALGPFAPRPAP